MKIVVGAAVALVVTVAAGVATGVYGFIYGGIGQGDGGFVITTSVGCLGFEGWPNPGFWRGIRDPGACDI